MMRTQLLATVIMATVAFPALAAESGPIPAWGTAKAPGAAARRAPVDIGSIAAANVFTKANYGTGSVALRNRLAGGLEVSTVPTPVKAAFLYWAVITDGSVPAADTKPTLKRLFPSTASVTLTGTAIGTGASPCWGGTGITVFKASVPTSVAKGNGLYEVIFPKGASGDPNGSDPWVVSPKFPLLEGATLLIVGTAASTVALYDKGLAGQTFSDDLSYQLLLPTSFGGAQLRIDLIGADGQLGNSRTALPDVSREVTTVNGTDVAGSDSASDGDSDWNGHIGDPVPQLWDDTSHDLRAAVSVGATSFNVTFTSTSDCLTPVANALLIR